MENVYNIGIRQAKKRSKIAPETRRVNEIRRFSRLPGYLQYGNFFRGVPLAAPELSYWEGARRWRKFPAELAWAAGWRGFGGMEGKMLRF